jgi:FkbM family methyltransferase
MNALQPYRRSVRYARTVGSWLLENAYRGRVKTTVQRLGVDRVVNRTRKRVRDATVPSEVVVTHGDVRLQFHVDNRFEYTVLTRYESDPDRTVLADFLDRLEPDDVVWDVGANVGIFSSFAADALGGDRVVAVEPLPQNTERIEANLARNGLEAHVHRAALSDEAGAGTFTVSSPDVTGAFGFLDDDDGEHVDVDIETGDGLVADGAPAPTVLKVDVQGGELGVLRGLTDTLRTDCRLVYCNVYEKHFETGEEGEEIRTLLEDAGFEVERIGEWSGGYFVRGERASAGRRASAGAARVR